MELKSGQKFILEIIIVNGQTCPKQFSNMSEKIVKQLHTKNFAHFTKTLAQKYLCEFQEQILFSSIHGKQRAINIERLMQSVADPEIWQGVLTRV